MWHRFGIQLRRQNRRRRGAVMILAVMGIVVFVSFLALVIDIGYLVNARAELQRTADSAAMAACWQYALQLSSGMNHEEASASAYSKAVGAAAANSICGASPAVQAADVSWGYLADFTDREAPLDTSDSSRFNAVKVTVRRSTTSNGQVPLFIGKWMGMDGLDSSASATAAIVASIKGFRTPADNSDLGILPITLKEQSWLQLLGGSGSDDWTWNSADGTIESGSDGVLELNLYPQNTNASGNSGTVDIGASGNSTADISRQITDGLSPEDLSHFGGKLELNSNGELYLNGDTGISAGVKDELASIMGKPRIIPIYRSVHGPGNNAEFKIVGWAGIRIMEVNLTGSKKTSKRVIIQPAPISTKGVISSTETSSPSNFVYSPVVLALTWWNVNQLELERC